MFNLPIAETVRAVESGASLASLSLAAAAFLVATWKRSALAVQKEVTETYRQCAAAEHKKAIDLEHQVRRLDARVRRLELDHERCEKRQSAARAEIEQFERIVRLLVPARSSLAPETRGAIERLLGEINRSREQAAADLFAWEQAQSYYAMAEASTPHGPGIA